ncbi:MAG: CRISPR-associated endonuclease Csn1 [Thiomicrorhabdus sp.]|nr:MAG: CRISPR-associated endonuclease Csn1 [Thiomicrorhabdus sp.]
MSKLVLGLDLGSNSLGWALYGESEQGEMSLVDIGCRIFSKAVEEKVPTPKNVKRRDMRLGRRVLQRRARRKQRMMNYLISLDLLPANLMQDPQPEVILNALGDPYELRVKGLDEQLQPHEFGRVLLHFVARRGFLSSKKQVAGDLIDDPDTMLFLNMTDDIDVKNKEEGQFKADIAEVKKSIQAVQARTLGEYLCHLAAGKCKRNRSHEGGHLRTDRSMYLEELELIWQQQQMHFKGLPDDFMEDKKGIKQIIFYQRPLKLKADRVGKCSLEPSKYRALTARLEVQQFRYLQDINNLSYFERHSEMHISPNFEQKEKLIKYFENNPKITVTKLKEILGLGRQDKLNLEAKNLKGNITACEVRSIIKEAWQAFTFQQQKALVEDLLTIQKKSVLKKRLIQHWCLSTQEAIALCLLEFEPSHSNHSLKAINKILPYLKAGDLYSEARQKAGYHYETKETTQKVVNELLAQPEETSNPIVNKGLHELKRVVNAIIKQHGKLFAIRIEMARDLEMNTKRYKENQAQQKRNQTANEKAVAAYKSLNLGKYPSYDDKIKYRLWQDQEQRCAYSNQAISLNQVFSSAVEIDHILPYKKSLDDSYMNKVLCFAAENRNKGDRTPKDAWGEQESKWNQITQSIVGWKGLKAKIARFYQTEKELQERDFISSQLNDTRYISKVAIGYLKTLGCDVSTSKGVTTAWLRHQWGLNTLIGEMDKKERTDHRHHAIDAAVVACVDRSLYQKILHWTKSHEQKLKVTAPTPYFRDQLSEYLKHMIVSHDVQRKLSGGLHEETGAGYIEKHGGLVYRKTLTADFTVKNTNSIVDETIKQQVLRHLEKYDNNPKKAFSPEYTVYHINGITPIKRVRVLQSKTTLKKLEQTKLPLKDTNGNIFKWMAFGNNHHVEIIKHTQTGKITGQFVNMFEAHRRAMTATKSAKERGVTQEPIIKIQHENSEFLMVLHINDLVSVEGENEERVFYRVQKLDSGSNRVVLRHHLAANLSNKQDEIMLGISAENFKKYKLKSHKVNCIGTLLND